MALVKNWAIGRSTYPSRFQTLEIVHGTSDDAMMACRRVMAENDGWLVCASDTEFINVSVKDPDDEFGMPIYEGSVLEMGKNLNAGTYFATNLDSDRGWVDEYEITDDGTVYHRSR
jgi:hypothetical protein